MGGGSDTASIAIAIATVIAITMAVTVAMAVAEVLVLQALQGVQHPHYLLVADPGPERRVVPEGAEGVVANLVSSLTRALLPVSY
jgi:hypothetical protein